MFFLSWWTLGCVTEELDVSVHCLNTEQHVVPTEDGAAVHLHRHRGQGPPVLVVHGISSNHHAWDLTEDRSLGVYLAEHGFDAWLLDLRGHGDARRDSLGKVQRAGWSVDDYARYDVSAAVSRIRSETGYAQVAYVGHSLGGMVGGIYAGSSPEADASLSSLVLVGSPMDFTDPDPVMRLGLQMGATASMILPVVPSQLGARFQAQIEHSVLPIDALLFRDIDTHHRSLMYRRIVSPLSKGELQQFGDVVQHHALRDEEGVVDHLDAFADVHTPTLVVAGRGDLIAPVDRVLGSYRRLGAEKKSFVVAGRATGFAVDYGHLDLTLGDHAQEEIYPRILQWIQE